MLQAQLVKRKDQKKTPSNQDYLDTPTSKETFELLCREEVDSHQPLKKSCFFRKSPINPVPSVPADVGEDSLSHDLEITQISRVKNGAGEM